MRKVMLTLVVFLLSVSFASAEVAVKIDHVDRGTAYVQTYSTIPLEETTSYDLYTIKKVNGKWKKEAFIRGVELPETAKERKGKYRYRSRNYPIEWLERGHIYALIPHDKGNHCSKPFWRKPLI